MKNLVKKKKIGNVIMSKVFIIFQLSTFMDLIFKRDLVDDS